jgi:ATP-dependent Clp protease adaptor protein ClpS
MSFSEDNLFGSSRSEKEESLSQEKSLVLYNDDINAFEYVIKTLTKVCGHDPLQAEQCASLAHYTGKCQIKKGDLVVLKHIQEELIEKGLKVNIE